MGKNKKRTASPQRDQQQSAANMTSPRAHRKTPAASLPLPFPSGFVVPKNSFLRHQDPYKEVFQAAIDTSYEGFAVDMPGVITEPSEETVQHALNRLEELGFFRTDVTQPFGLGTKCAKTYVTRCLLGDQGTTYKYLGLRMFCHPWNCGDEEAVQVIRQLNDSLTKRTEHHLSELCMKRSKRGGTVQGRARFDICLVNRMQHSPDLKEEPSLGEGKCAVSWHADSSLEHYSTIAVYQTVVGNESCDTSKDNWSVALRVAHHAEGPESSRRGRDIQSSLVENTPNLSVSLPSGSAYYLLDDFNHHHQHAVVSEGSNEDIRYSCTHRLLRTSHNVNFILERCQKVCSLFHKKGSKIWRAEQLLLTEIESEWIRQFYIQGKQHYDLLWKYWGDSIRQLLRYWGQLETRTKRTADFLQLAAEARCGIDADGPPASKAERKKRDKRKKALDHLEELLSRNDITRTSAIHSLYESLADLLRERAEMRRLWQERENDHVFRELDRSQRPLPVPFVFDGMNTDKSGDGSAACSPMPEDLVSVADRLAALGQGCACCDPKRLPADCLTSSNAVPQQMQVKDTTSAVKDSAKNDHCRSQTWEGWSERQVGLEMQVPWAGLLLQGKKTIETRAYDLPPALLGRRIEILQSKQGDLTSSLGNVVCISEEDPVVTRLGWCTFTRVIRYEDSELFDADQSAHLVVKGSNFYPFGKEKRTVFGWVVGHIGYDIHTNDYSVGSLKTIVRRYRSLFELQYAASNLKTAAVSIKKRKKRRRY